MYCIDMNLICPVNSLNMTKCNMIVHKLKNTFPRVLHAPFSFHNGGYGPEQCSTCAS